MKPTRSNLFSDLGWLEENIFAALAEISSLLSSNDNRGRDALIRVLEHRERFKIYDPILVALIQKAGLYPYVGDVSTLSTADMLNFEFHTVEGLDELVLHSVQGKVYRALCDGANVILSAPTSFGKSLLIDAMIASRRFKQIVVIVPTIALIDETRRRLAARFSPEFKIVTHQTQAASDKNIYVLTQERLVEFETTLLPEFFVLDEFYKLSPSRDDERTFVLNHAFYKLIKTGAQFFLIGPNVQDITIKSDILTFRYFRTDFSTVATEVKFYGGNDTDASALGVCKTVSEPTLIFCKSASSAYKLAGYLLANGIVAENKEAQKLAAWLRNNFHPDWVLATLLDAGFAIHHGALPRSIAYHILRLFNEGAIRFLLCTSTIIEGVNTSAKHLIIYDNKIATAKFDQFTFNNIKGRAGRMFKHFVGYVHVLQDPPPPELPLVDFPSITQPEDVPESLLIQLDDADLSLRSQEKIRYLHAQDILPFNVMRGNSGIDPYSQLNVAEEITNNLGTMHSSLRWSGFPTSPQLMTVCSLIFTHLMNGKGKDGVFSAKQLHFKMTQFTRIKDMKLLFSEELVSNAKVPSATVAVEMVLTFLRKWAEFNFPRYLAVLDSIQRSVFERNGLEPGNYQVYGAAVKQLFLPLSATVLEEYGLPFQITMKLEGRGSLGESVDAILANVQKVDEKMFALLEIEQTMLSDTIANL